jgi:two-component system sensor histidine kinase PilS (NtrC family)
MEIALQKADRLAALGELSARMAHEIRNPIAALCGSVQLLSNSTGRCDTRLLAIITREAERLDALISEFLMYARPNTPLIKKIGLRAYIEEIFYFLTQDPRFSNVTLQNFVPESVVIDADPDQFRQVIINLLQNAADAIPDHGKIWIEHSADPATTCISITDNGTGISRDATQHLFEPFWTTKTNGTGLGLAISYRIIEAHNGTLSVEIPPSGGSRFVITLPVLLFE